MRRKGSWPSRPTSIGGRRRGATCPIPTKAARKAQSLRARLDTDQFTRDLGDAIAALRARPDCTGKVGVMGFCLGGMFAYLASTRLPIDAAVSYYGVQIDQHLGEADRLKCPILHALRRERSARAGADRGGDPGAPWRTGSSVNIHVYPGTEHGFNRQGYPPYNEAAATQARQRTIAHFRRLLSYGKERRHERTSEINTDRCARH